MSRGGEPPPETVERDGLAIAYEVTGADDGFPVFLLHGTPGSRKGPKPRNIALYRMGVRLICHDRPGYGDSDRRPGRTVADAARDVEVIADHLGIDQFAVVGRSGGGPHALACAADAALRDRISRVGVLVSVAPADAPELDWYAGMNDDNRRDYATASSDEAALIEDLRLRADQLIDDPESLLKTLISQMTAPDLRVISNTALRRLITATHSDALRAGPYGWIDDALALRSNWQVDLSGITARVRLWHGADDNFAPASHTRWLARQIRRAEIEVQPSAAHFAAIEVLPGLLTWLSAGRMPNGDSALIGARPIPTA